MRFTCAQCGRRIIPSDDDAGICVDCGGRNRLEEDNEWFEEHWPDAVALFLVALFGVLGLAYSCSVKADDTIYQVYPNSNIPDYTAPSWTLDDDGTIYRNHPNSTIPDYTQPQGRIQQKQWDIKQNIELDKWDLRYK